LLAEKAPSSHRLKEAISVYWLARKHWPQEDRLMELAELFL
jgi:hypothetical protein